MSDNVYLNADKTAVVSEFAAGKKWQVRRAEAAKLGLLDSTEKPVQERRLAPTEEPVAEHTGPLAPKPQKRRKPKR